MRQVQIEHRGGAGGPAKVAVAFGGPLGFGADALTHLASRRRQISP
jgi:hypothetical protein